MKLFPSTVKSTAEPEYKETPVHVPSAFICSSYCTYPHFVGNTFRVDIILCWLDLNNFTRVVVGTPSLIHDMEGLLLQSRPVEMYILAVCWFRLLLFLVVERMIIWLLLYAICFLRVLLVNSHTEMTGRDIKRAEPNIKVKPTRK